MTIYIIGPITGKPLGNIEEFRKAQKEVQSMHPKARVIIPHELYTPDRAASVCPALCWCEAMARCLPIAEAADLLVALPGWQDSRGARVEHRHRNGWFIEYVELMR